MQQQNFDALMYEKKQRFNRLEREEVVPRYRSASPPYYWKENLELEERALNFEPQIHYVVEQEATTQGIKMSRGVELVIVTKQEIIILPKVEPTIT